MGIQGICGSDGCKIKTCQAAHGKVVPELVSGLDDRLQKTRYNSSSNESGTVSDVSDYSDVEAGNHASVPTTSANSPSASGTPIKPKGESCTTYLLNEMLSSLPDDTLHCVRSRDSVGDISADESRAKLMSKRDVTQLVAALRKFGRKLNKFSLKLEVKNVLISAKIYDVEPIIATRRVTKYLLDLENNGNPINVHIQDIVLDMKTFGYAELVAEKPDYKERIKSWAPDTVAAEAELYDFIITIGGDGTILFASWMFQQACPPVLGFGLGSLGFLTESPIDQYEKIVKTVIEKGFRTSLRMRFTCTIMKAMPNHIPMDQRVLRDEIENPVCLSGNFPTHEPIHVVTIFNDVVVGRGPNPNMTTTELYADCEYLTTIDADGVVIATPSGSTAYSMSAGGSLVHPEIPGMLISPICPHTLSFRPLVVPESVILRIGVPYSSRSTAWCSFDGKSRFELEKGDFLTVTTSQYPFPMIETSHNSLHWFKGISNTLHWNERQRQKPFKLPE